MRIFKLHNSILDFLISKSGRFLAIWSGTEGDIFLYDVASGEQLVTFKDCHAACFMENYFIASIEASWASGEVRVFDCVARKKTQTWYTPSIITSYYHHHETVIGFADMFIELMRLDNNGEVMPKLDTRLQMTETVLGIYGDYLVYQQDDNREKCFSFYNLKIKKVEKPTLPNIFRLISGVVGILVKEDVYQKSNTFSDYIETPNEIFTLMFHPERGHHQIFMQHRHQWLNTVSHVHRIEATDSLLFYSSVSDITVMDLDSIL